MLNSAKKYNLQSHILQWYRLHGRRLPWRNTSDPYRILVSEIMLQQTQVSRVQEKYPLFLKRFPTMQALAEAPQRDVVIAWQGMGYNNRAVRLHKLAQAVTNNHKGKLTDRYQTLLALPGIGRYTANAILSSAFRQAVPVVDTNVRRVLSRLLWRMRSLRNVQEEDTVWQAADALLPRRASYQWNQALMDLGATICTARAPLCRLCPARSFCFSALSMVASETGSPRREPQFRGIPNRIYRGRVIELLRKTDPHQIDVRKLGTRLHNGSGKPSAAWLQSLLRSLERDGLVRLRRDQRTKKTNVALA